MGDDVLVGTTAANRSRRVYHTDPDCDWLPDQTRQWDRDETEAWGYSECTYCAGEIGSPDGGDKSLYQAAIDFGRGGSDD